MSALNLLRNRFISYDQITRCLDDVDKLIFALKSSLNPGLFESTLEKIVSRDFTNMFELGCFSPNRHESVHWQGEKAFKDMSSPIDKSDTINNLPPELHRLQEIARERWTICNITYPWIPQKYGNKQMVLTDDGFILIRFEVLDPVPGGFTQFRIMDHLCPEDRIRYPLDSTVNGDFVRRIHAELRLPKIQDLVGQILTKEQISNIILGEISQANAKVGMPATK